MIDLNTVVDASGAGWTLTEGTAINENGWIVGFGKNSLNQTDAFLLAPVPEPPSILLFMLGVSAVAALNLRRSGVEMRLRRD
jgi:hypothetical protein